MTYVRMRFEAKNIPAQISACATVAASYGLRESVLADY